MSRLNLELPIGYKDEDLGRILNERFRRIAEALGGGTGSAGATGARGATGAAGASGGAGTLILSVAGSLSIRSSATPLASFAFSRTFTSLSALLKRPAVGGDIAIRMLVAGAERASLNVPAGDAQGTVTFGAVTVGAGAIVTFDLTSVGSTYPGADLTLVAS